MRWRARGEACAAARRVWGINPELLPGGARLVCELCEFAAGMVFAKEVITNLLYRSVPAPGWRETYGWVRD
jgi:hypothetical protein